MERDVSPEEWQRDYDNYLKHWRNAYTNTKDPNEKYIAKRTLEELERARAVGAGGKVPADESWKYRAE